MNQNNCKILLINPVTRNCISVLRVERCQQKTKRTVGLWPPITLIEMALQLNHNGYTNVSIIDAEAERFSFDTLIHHIVQSNPNIVVIQATTPTLPDDLSLAENIKKNNNAITVIFTGLHATVLPSHILEHPSVDFALMGEPEHTLTQLVKAITRHDTHYHKIPGLYTPE